MNYKKHILHIIACIGCVVALSSCEEKWLQRDLANYKAPFGYLHDSKPNKTDRKDSVYVIVKGASYSDSTQVVATDKIIIPLLVVNYFSTTMKVTLGKKSMMGVHSDFMYESFLLEAERTGSFGILSEANDSSAVYEITIDSCYTTAVYKKRNWSVLLTVGVASETEQAEAAVTHLYATARLKKKGLVLSEKKYAVITNPQYYIKGRARNEEEIKSALTSNLLEALSEGTKKCIESMIADLNTQFQAK